MNDHSGAVEPLAIVGMACRFPGGVDTLDRYWRLLLEGGLAVGEVPPERWDAPLRGNPDHAGTLRHVTRRGNFLADAAGFDADFFGVTPREAELMDPQQRLVLEVAWEALEHAGIPPLSLAGTETGVVMGVGSDDYGRQLLEDLPRIEAWTGVGASCCVVANRVSYSLDLRGPSFTVDAACASSLVAVHLAASALRAGECGVALAGGVNLIASPALTVVLDAARAISPDGRSKPFDAAADGYGRGEGAGVIVLKRLADAERDGDRVLALLRGSAVSQDGRTQGIMAPNGEAQGQVVRLALRQAGVDAASVGFVEAHGTGTRAGDPIEAAALGAVFGAARPAGQPCLVGSVKSNIGHLEAAAGIAGMIKAVLALQHGELPPQAGLSSVSPAIDWAALGLRVLTERTAWPAGDSPRRAGVSGFGYGGTVAHVILERAPVTAAPGREPAGGQTAARPAGGAAAAGGPWLFPLSGASVAALHAQAAALADAVDPNADAAALADIQHTLWQRRSHLARRAAVVARDARSLRYELGRLAADQPSQGVTTGEAPHGASAHAVWVFSGHGSQWPGMGRELLAAEPVFAAVVDALEAVFRAEIGFSPRAVLESGDLGGVDCVQAMTFVMQVGLAAVWHDLGLTPAAVVGHSVGEVAAAVVAGALSLLDGARLICRRSVLLRRVAGAGAMAMVRLPFAAVEMRLSGDDVTAAVEASPDSTVVAGTPEGVTAFMRGCEADGIVVRRVRSDVAFHTAQMQPLASALAAALAELRPGPPAVRLYSSALDDPRSDAPRDAVYWAANLRQPVRFASAIAAAADDGHRLFLEVSAHPVVAHSVAETLAARGAAAPAVASSLRRDRPERAALLGNLGALHCRGAAVAPRTRGALVTLPGTAWQHTRFWRDPVPADQSSSAGHDPGSGHLLGSPLEVADPSAPRAWRTRLTQASRPYPGEHQVHGIEIVPAAVLAATFFAAAGQRSLSEVRFASAVRTTPGSEVQVIEQSGALRLLTRPTGREAGADGRWETHATASAGAGGGAAQPAPAALELGAIRERCPQALAPDAVVTRLQDVGIAGAALPWTTPAVWSGPGELLLRVRIARDGEAVEAGLRWTRMIDAVSSAAALAFPGEPVLRLLSGIRRIELDAELPDEATVHVRRTGDTAADAIVADADGRVLGVIDGLTLSPLDEVSGPVAASRLLHRIDWRAVPEPKAARPLRRVLLVGADGPVTDAIAARATGQGIGCQVVPALDESLVAALDDRDAVLVLGPGAPAGPVEESAEALTWRLARTAQRLTASEQVRPPRLWAVTTGVREGLGADSLAQAPLWGLGQIIGGEHPELWGGILDLDAAAVQDGAEQLLAALRARTAPEILAARDGVTLAARLAPVPEAPARPAPRCRPDGTYLITGGLGGLGLQTAHWLAARGARRLILAGRTPMPPRRLWDAVTEPALAARITAIRGLEAAGITVRVVALDIADRATAPAALDTEALGLPPVRGVVHAAGVLDNRLLAGLDRASLHAILAPKVTGALVLSELYPPGCVDFFVLFSSIGQFLGLPGQAGYAAASAFLDGLARHRRARGDDGAVSLCWTSWRGPGMGANDVVRRELGGRGIGMVSADEAFAAWELASRHDCGQPCVFPVMKRADGFPVAPLFSELDHGIDDASAPAASVDRYAGLSPEQLRARLRVAVAEQVALEMRLPAENLDIRLPLSALGLDSLMTLAIRRRLDQRFRTSLPATLVWNHPTVEGIAEFLAERFSAEAADREPADAL